MSSPSDPLPMAAEELRRLFDGMPSLNSADAFPPGLRTLLRDFHHAIAELTADSTGGWRDGALDVDGVRRLAEQA